MNHVILHHAPSGGWQVFEHPLETVVARTAREVLPALQRIEDGVNRHSLYAAGFIAYEAAPAFDAALRVRDDTSGFPALWFGLYKTPLLTQALAPTRPPAAVASPDWSPAISRNDYLAALARLRDYLYRGDTYQVNFTFRLRAPFDSDPWPFFLKLVQAQNARHTAFVETDRFTLCSASPELFFALNGDRLESRPMKGTTRRGRSAAEDVAFAEALRESPKNRAENVMIVDMIRNDMGRVAVPGSVTPECLFALEKYPTAWQMTSTVASKTRASVCEILTALFPCASVTGAPKPRTMAIIAELETTARRIYTGAIGFLGPGRRAEFNVAIRTALIDRQQGTAEYGVGGGIVWDSDSREEYEECWTKARILTVEQPEFQLLETILWTPREGFFLLDRHLERLLASAGYFDIPASKPAVEAALRDWAASAPSVAQRVRLLVAREGTVSVQAQAFNAPPEAPVRLRLAPHPIDPDDRFLYHKTTRRRVYEEARAAAPDADDVLLWNPKEELTETTIANLVVELDGERVTPPVSCGLLPGTFRAALLAEGAIREGVVRRSDLPRCRRLWLINSVRQWREAVLLD